MINGKGVVTYKGEEVWKGEVKDTLRSASKINKTQEEPDGEFAAVWDGEEVIWENVDGAAEALETK